MGTVSIFLYRKFGLNERLIVIVILLNVIADLMADYVSLTYGESGHVYNVLAPVERLLSLQIYVLATKNKKLRMLFRFTMILIFGISLSGYIIHNGDTDFHALPYVASGFLMAVASYIFLREWAIVSKKSTVLVFVFGMANFIYYTLMISSMSALPLANKLSAELADKIYVVNDIAYTLWSLTILFGMIWQRIKT